MSPHMSPRALLWSVRFPNPSLEMRRGGPRLLLPRHTRLKIGGGQLYQRHHRLSLHVLSVNRLVIITSGPKNGPQKYLVGFLMTCSRLRKLSVLGCSSCGAAGWCESGARRRVQLSSTKMSQGCNASQCKHIVFTCNLICVVRLHFFGLRVHINTRPSSPVAG